MITIFGAGLAGLIAARMTLDRQPYVLEKQDSLPNNHAALLRFRSDVVGNACNIPFRKVQVTKQVYQSKGQVQDAFDYSRKVSGKLQARSILDTATSSRWIAPDNLVAQLAATANIKYSMDFLQWTNNLIKPHKPPIISTIPMPIMMKIFGYDDVQFNYVKGWTVKTKINPELECAMNATIYFPGEEPWYRISVTDNNLIIEGVGEPPNLNNIHFQFALKPFGLTPEDVDTSIMIPKVSTYQKIGELSNADREKAKRFVMRLTQEHGIYSLGRFATWRPKVLLDDLVNDVRVICRLIDGDTAYSNRIQA